MKTIKPSISRRRGLTLMEALISLSIMAALLTAMAMAFQVSGVAMEQNDQLFRSLHQARVAINLMTRDIRCVTANPTVTSTSVSMTTNAYGTSAQKVYTYVAASGNTPGQITLSTNGGTAFVLATNVASASFNSVTSGASVTDISIKITVQYGGNTVSLSDSAEPRMNMTFTMLIPVESAQHRGLNSTPNG